MTQEQKYVPECVQCAKLIRADLKAKYPGVKFRVITHRYSGGNSITVYWTDGPLSKDVDTLLSKYEDGDFDGMTDCYNYRPNPDNTPRTKYLFVNREISEPLRSRICEVYREKYGEPYQSGSSNYEMDRRYYEIERVTEGF